MFNDVGPKRKRQSSTNATQFKCPSLEYRLCPFRVRFWLVRLNNCMKISNVVIKLPQCLFESCEYCLATVLMSPVGQTVSLKCIENIFFTLDKCSFFSYRKYLRKLFGESLDGNLIRGTCGLTV